MDTFEQLATVVIFAMVLSMDRRLCPLPVCQDESKMQHCEVRVTPSAHTPGVTLGTRRNILCHTVFLLLRWRSSILRKSLVSVFKQQSGSVRCRSTPTETRKVYSLLYRKLIHHHKIQEKTLIVSKGKPISLGLVTTAKPKVYSALCPSFSLVSVRLLQTIQQCVLCGLSFFKEAKVQVQNLL